MIFVESAALVVSVLLLYVVWRLSLDVRGIRDGVLADLRSALTQQWFAEGRFGIGNGNEVHEGHREAGRPRNGRFVVWVWRDGEWKARGLPAGAQPPLPPPYPGAYSGDLAKTWVTVHRP